MKSNFYKFSLGLLSVIFLFDLMVIDKQSKNESFVELSATFNKIDGLTEGANIMISGINVGFVDQIKLIKNYPVVSMQIKKDIKISEDSSISIQTDGLFGSKFLLIELGGVEETLEAGDSFSFAEDSILLQDLLQNIIKIGEKNKL